MKYELISEYIKNEISNGKIKSGEKLPSVRDLCSKFSCSKETVIKAYTLLESEHVVYSIPKSGYYLIENVENNFSPSDNTCNRNIDFSTSAPDVRILPYKEFEDCLNQAMRLYKEKLTSDFNTHGLENLIDVVQKQLQNYQVFADKNCIFITSGSQQAINILTMMTFANNGQTVLVEQPTYYGAMESLKLNNINIIGIDRNENGIDFYELENIFKNNDIKFFYVIPRFHNPTGFSYSKNQKKHILELCEKYDVYIVEDDYLSDLELDTKSDPLYALDIYSRVIYLKTYSKILLPGLRIAAAVLPQNLSESFGKYKKWNDLSTSVLSQGALELYIKSGMFDEHVRKLRKVYSERMSYLKEVVKGFDDLSISWNIPDSGFFACFKISNIKSKNNIRKLSEKGVLITDPNRFYLDKHIQNKLIRLSVSRTNDYEIKKGVDIIYDIGK